MTGKEVHHFLAGESQFKSWSETSIENMILKGQLSLDTSKDENGRYLTLIGYQDRGQEREIFFLKTSVSHRRTGLMRKHLAAFLKKSPDISILLEVDEANLAAVELYRLLGFCQVGYRPDYYSNGNGALLLEFKKP